MIAVRESCAAVAATPLVPMRVSELLHARPGLGTGLSVADDAAAKGYARESDPLRLLTDCSPGSPLPCRREPGPSRG